MASMWWWTPRTVPARRRPPGCSAPSEPGSTCSMPNPTAPTSMTAVVPPIPVRCKMPWCGWAPMSGIALDGDADRALAVDAGGRLIDGDQILAITGIDRKARQALPRRCRRRHRDDEPRVSPRDGRARHRRRRGAGGRSPCARRDGRARSGAGGRAEWPRGVRRRRHDRRRDPHRGPAPRRGRPLGASAGGAGRRRHDPAAAGPAQRQGFPARSRGGRRGGEWQPTRRP